MEKLARGKSGKFTSKSDEARVVRSIRLTDTTWKKLGDVADSRCITRGDLVEQLVREGILEKNSPQSGVVSLQQVEKMIACIIDDPEITRHGKDRGSVKRALQALLGRLS